jgi:3-hydroxyisobutyrate dehydrogenase-like beta-hydroxyacid dehydrogenase
MTEARIGLIGVGMMGLGIASNLARKGQRLTVMEHAGNQPLDSLRALGVDSVESPQALAQVSDIVILCVSASPQVEAILAGPQGLLAGIRAGSLVIDCSTSLPESTLRVAAQVRAAGARFVDSPMTRTPKEAAEGRLNLLVGGDAADVAQCRPILECFAENITHVGPVGAGHQMKLLHNFVSLGSVALIAEAAACARDAGIGDEVFVDVLGKGGGWGAALERVKPYLLSGDNSAIRFSLANARKDVDYFRQMAIAQSAAHQIADGVFATLDAACDKGDPQGMVLQLVDLLARNPQAKA